MGLLALLRKPTENKIDLWKKHHQTYVTRYRLEIEALAKNLSSRTPLFTRFNPKQKCAELFFADGIIFAQINMHGSHGIEYEAIITSALSLSKELQDSFRSIFSKLKVKFKHLL